MLLLDYSSVIANVDDVVLPFKYFPFPELAFELNPEKTFEWLDTNESVSGLSQIL